MNPSIVKNFGIPYLQNALMADYTTFRLGGTCRGMFFCNNIQKICQAVKFCRDQALPFIVIGGGSNIVVSDEGIDAYVIRYVSEDESYEAEGNLIKASACLCTDRLAEIAAKKGLAGINYLSGIPGTIGGAVVGNAGAFGKQIGDVVNSVTFIDSNNNLSVIPASLLQFSYRWSSLKEKDSIVVSVELNLKPADPAFLLKEREEILLLRKEKHPDWRDIPCAGSFFRNIEPSSNAGQRRSAGWFLEQAGARTVSINQAQVYEKHANILIKGPDTKAQDIFDLSTEIAKMVKDKFGIELIREVRFAGTFKGMPETKNIFW
jgi:UDP-N-acetylmuramate dehydrogenase